MVLKDGLEKSRMEARLSEGSCFQFSRREKKRHGGLRPLRLESSKIPMLFRR